MSALDGASGGLVALTAGAEGALARLFAEGQPAKVRTENGRVVTGLPTAERRLELTL